MRAYSSSIARWLMLALMPLLGTACVGAGLYDETYESLQQSRAEAARNGAQAAALLGDVKRLNEEVARLAQEVAKGDARLAELAVVRSNDAKKLDDLMALNDELSQRLKAAGHSVEALAGERGALAKALADTKARLDELRKQQAAAEARAAQFRDLVARLRKLIDGGQLKVAMRGGRMILELPNDVLFDSGRTDLKDIGRRTLTEIGQVLKTMRDRRFQVAGHTDNVKILTAHFPSNWELSASRAIAVVKLLAESGMEPKNLSAAGYGEFAPVVSNDTPEGRAKNRRIEITLVPNLEELVAVPEASPPPPAPAKR